MATKNDPGEFDCHAAADPDEPIFTLRARDPLAPALVRAWLAMRRVVRPMSAERDKARETRKRREAGALADAMELWRFRKEDSL